LAFTKTCYTSLEEIHNILSNNKIWKQRLLNIGVLSYEDCRTYALTGVLARSCGIKRDLRLLPSYVYSSYDKLNLKSFCGINGDSYDRYLIRMLEMLESLNIIKTVGWKLLQVADKKDLYYSENLVNRLLSGPAIDSYSSMEDLISHFVVWHSGFRIQSNTALCFIESPKGEFGVSLLSDGSEKPTTCKIRSPSYFNLQCLPKMVKGHCLSDLAAIIGTIDIVFGEIDR
jgi:NADH:ubiquinone oxidoreductase subunit D